MNPEVGEYYNIGGTHVCKIGDMLETLMSMSHIKNISIEVDKDRLRPIDADLQIPDTTKFTQKTGWKPEILFEKTMSDLLEYWRKKILIEGHTLVR
jgi:GDPmannose 4,6-dehydratase